MSQNPALIFDMDGVVVNSNPVHREAWLAYNRRFGVETTDEMMARMYGKRNDEIIRDFFGAQLSDGEVFAHGAAKEQLYREMIEPTLNDAILPGLREFLERHRDWPKGVATNAEPKNLEFVLERAGLRHYFQFVIDGHQVERAKPFPDIYLRAAEQLGTAPRDCVVFEDSYTGVTAGVAAGMHVVGVKSTHTEFENVEYEIEDFRDAGLADYLSRVKAARVQ